MPVKPAPKHKAAPPGVRKYAFWFKDDVMAVLEGLKAQTGMSKSQIMRDLVMALGAGLEIEHMPTTTALPQATEYWKHRALVAAGKVDP